MVVSFADILLVVIAVFGVFGVFRGVRAGALTTGAIFFAFVVVVLAGDLVISVFRRLGVPLATPDTQALFKAALFLFTLLMASRVLAAIAAVPRRALSRREKLWGLVPALSIGHAGPDTWSVRLVPSSFTLLPPGSSGDLWTRLPLALVLLLLFLAFVFVGTIYGRVNRRSG